MATLSIQDCSRRSEVSRSSKCELKGDGREVRYLLRRSGGVCGAAWFSSMKRRGKAESMLSSPVRDNKINEIKRSAQHRQGLKGEVA